MKISIITATYNSEISIVECIESVNSQDHIDIEHIFIDGKSSDDTLELINKNSKVNNKILSEKDTGIYDALNKGIEMATGDIIGVVHSDDILPSTGILSQVADAFEQNDLELVYGDLTYVTKRTPKRVLRYWRSCDFSQELILSGWMPPHPTLFIRKEIFEKWGKYDLSYKIAADFDFILRIFKNPNLKTKYLPKVLCEMKVGGESNRNIGNILLKTREDLTALKKNEIDGPYAALIRKNLYKLPQFIKGIKFN